MITNEQTNTEEEVLVEAIATNKEVALTAEEMQKRKDTSIQSLKLTSKVIRARRDLGRLLEKTGVADLNGNNMSLLASVCGDMVGDEIKLLMSQFDIDEFNDTIAPEGSNQPLACKTSSLLFQGAQFRVFIEILNSDRFVNLTKKEKNQLSINGYVILKEGETSLLAMSMVGFFVVEKGLEILPENLSDLDFYIDGEDLEKAIIEVGVTEKKKKRFGLI